MRPPGRRRPRAEPGDWFVPNRFGFGVVPVASQGWALLAGYAGGAIAVVRLTHSDGLRAGLRWRWGGGRD